MMNAIDTPPQSSVNASTKRAAARTDFTNNCIRRDCIGKPHMPRFPAKLAGWGRLLEIPQELNHLVFGPVTVTAVALGQK